MVTIMNLTGQFTLGNFIKPPVLKEQQACLVLFSVAVIKHYGQKHLGEDSVYLSDELQSITVGSLYRNSSMAGSWNQERKQRLWRIPDYWLPSMPHKATFLT